MCENPQLVDAEPGALSIWEWLKETMYLCACGKEMDKLKMEPPQPQYLPKVHPGNIHQKISYVIKDYPLYFVLVPVFHIDD